MRIPPGGYRGAVATGTFRDLLTAVAGSAAALTGLLFVALSVAPRRVPQWGSPVIRQIRAAAALMSFINALAVSLFTLVPGTNIGYPALVMGIIGITFTAAAMRSILSSKSTPRQKRNQLGLIALLLLIFGVELVAGIAVLAHPGDENAVNAIGYALVTSLIAGIMRAWELVGDRDTGLVASLAELTRRSSHSGSEPADGAAGRPEARAAPEAARSESAARSETAASSEAGDSSEAGPRPAPGAHEDGRRGDR